MHWNLSNHRFGWYAFVASLFAIPTAVNADSGPPRPAEPPIARVFILAGQSNMAGHGVVDLDDPKDYNGGLGTLADVIKRPKNKTSMGHLRNNKGDWNVRDDVFVWYQTDAELKTGGLGVGYTSYQGARHHFGPELQFGHVVGAAFDEPVLLIKTAWGGKSLFKDFRPPGAGGEVGPYYRKMMKQIDEALKQAPTKFPALKDHQLVVSGFVWQQGWNDMIEPKAVAEYESNMLNLISSLRSELKTPDLPFVYGELGNGGESTNESMKTFRAAQAAVANHNDPRVVFVKTAQFARPAEQSPNRGHLHHWFGNAESYYLVGDALGHAMVNQVNLGLPRVLILGDSISIGYMPYVRKQLSGIASVFRPMRNERAAENCAGTDYGILNIDRWLKQDGGNWDVIHFNFGLHDMKHVDRETGNASNEPTDPLQSGPEEYEKQLREIVAKLKATNAKLILCTTTPYPAGCQPLRDVESPAIYNEIAKRIAKENEIPVNDIAEFARPLLSEIQRPVNVHFTPAGSERLATEVSKAIRER